MDTLSIVGRIESLLKELHMSKGEFYRQTGISSASFSQWRSGVYNPSEKNLRSAAAVLGVSYEYLAFGLQKEIAPAVSGEGLSAERAELYSLIDSLDDDAVRLLLDMVRTVKSWRTPAQE